MKAKRPYFYALDEAGEPVAIGGVDELVARRRDLDVTDPKRVVGRTPVSVTEVSTVFLMCDHAFSGPPVLWETAIITGSHFEIVERCSGGREQAEAMHAKWVRLARRRMPVRSNGKKPISRRRASSDVAGAEVREPNKE